MIAFLSLTAAAAPALASAGAWQNNLPLGGFNKVHLYTPDSDSPVGNGKALLIVLHGCTQSIDAYKTANLEAAAEEYGMVVAVPDAMNKAGFGCWSYWQGSKSRSAGDYKNLINLANTLSGDAARGIDPNQVYIAGLSSGASFANTTACLAPDVFAGVGVSAGPSVGTSSSGAIVCVSRRTWKAAAAISVAVIKAPSTLRSLRSPMVTPIPPWTPATTGKTRKAWRGCTVSAKLLAAPWSAPTAAARRNSCGRMAASPCSGFTAWTTPGPAVKAPPAAMSAAPASITPVISVVSSPGTMRGSTVTGCQPWPNWKSPSARTGSRSAGRPVTRMARSVTYSSSLRG
ncbi:alpha/beta hydrolase family esterase [Alloalcanivorax xenomutans]|uniref:alpha/beta hydrolase family esterase n=1 Tax=Alloalcanivorax xenomutans TaxID=1094342 RepID=UPI003BAD48D3